MRFRNYILESLSTAEKYYTMSIDDMLNDVRGRPLVFFDCETSGLDPYLPHVQITEIGGVAVFPNGQKRSFHKKIALKPETIKAINYEKQNGVPIDGDAKGKKIGELLSMNKYDSIKNFDQTPAQAEAEAQVLAAFKKFVEDCGPNVILVAQNSDFDVKQILTRIRVKYYKVMDTMMMCRIFVQSLLDSLLRDKSLPEYDQLLEMKKHLTNKQGNPCNNLKSIGLAFGENSKDWHSGWADVNQLMRIFFKMIKFLSDYKDRLNEGDLQQTVAKDKKRHWFFMKGKKSGNYIDVKRKLGNA